MASKRDVPALRVWSRAGPSPSSSTMPARDDVVDEHRPVVPGLQLAHQADGSDLQVLLQIPPVAEDGEDVAAVLQVQAVPALAGWANRIGIFPAFQSRMVCGLLSSARPSGRLSAAGPGRS